MPFEGRLVDLGEQIRCAVVSFLFAALRWWLAALQVRLTESRNHPNKVRTGSLEQEFSGQSQLCIVSHLLEAVLPWWEPKATKKINTGASSIRSGSWSFLAAIFSFLCLLWLVASSEFNGGFAFIVMRLKARCAGSWRFGARGAMPSPSRRHGGGRGEMGAALRRPVFDDHGVIEAFDFSSLSSMVHGDLMELLVCSSVCPTSDVRTLLKSAVAAVRVGIEASGDVPATVFDDGKLGFLLDGRERE